MNKKISNEKIPASMVLPRDVSLSENSKHIRKEIDDWLKEGNKKTIITTKAAKWRTQLLSYY